MNNQDEKNLKKYISSISPMKLWKQKLLIILGVIIVVSIITGLLLVIPFVNNQSAIGILIEKFKNVKSYNSSDILNLVAQSSTWLLITWGITLKTLQTLTYRKQRKEYMKKKEKQGIKLTPKQAIKEIDINEKRINDTLTYIMQIANEEGLVIRGTIAIEVRKILADTDDDVQSRIERIKTLFRRYNVDIETSKRLSKAMKEVKKIK